MRAFRKNNGAGHGAAAILLSIVILSQLPLAFLPTPDVPNVPTSRFLSLKGAPDDMWRQFGASEKKAVRDNLDLFLKQTAAAGIPRSELRSKALDAARFLPEDFLKEVRALADGAGVCYPDLLALNIQSDNAGWSDDCTLFLAVGSGSQNGDTLASKNRDYVSSGAQVLVLMRPASGNSFMGVMTAGQTGISMGINEKGLSIQDTQLPVPAVDKAGYSGFTIMEHVMEACSNVDMAISYIANTTKHSGITYSVADSEKGAFIETVPSSYTPNVSSRMVPDGIAVHTNHYMYEPFRSWVLNGSFGSINPASYARYDRAVALARAAGNSLTPEFLMGVCRDLKDFRISDREAVMTAHPEVPANVWSGDSLNCSICNDLTIASTVMEIDRVYPDYLSTMWMAIGNPSFSPYVPIHNAVLANMTRARQGFASFTDGTAGKLSLGLQNDGSHGWGKLDAGFVGWEARVRQKENLTCANASLALAAGHNEQAASVLLKEDAMLAGDGVNLLRGLDNKQAEHPLSVPFPGIAGLLAAFGLGFVLVSPGRSRKTD